MLLGADILSFASKLKFPKFRISSVSIYNTEKMNPRL
jgi:hypothetical protein